MTRCISSTQSVSSRSRDRPSGSAGQSAPKKVHFCHGCAHKAKLSFLCVRVKLSEKKLLQDAKYSARVSKHLIVEACTDSCDECDGKARMVQRRVAPRRYSDQCEVEGRFVHQQPARAITVRFCNLATTLRSNFQHPVMPSPSLTRTHR